MVARLRGNGTKQPILIMAHTDVVGVQRENWSVDPFEAVAKDGYIYGRGSLDDKDNVTAAPSLMLLLRRTGVELDRDVIFLAEAGEEGTTRFGIDYMVDQHWDRIAAEFCLAEGEPQHYSLLRTSVVPTMISGGFRRNVIPTEAEATFDIRGLPDENPGEFYQDLAGVINDPNIEIIPEGVYRPASPPSKRSPARSSRPESVPPIWASPFDAP